jgi:hypothetical protein
VNPWKDTGDAAAGLKRIPLHLIGFGAPFGALVWFGGWSGAAVLVAWRAYAEFLDWREMRDTAAKALIDLVSQTAIPAVIAIVRGA